MRTYARLMSKKLIDEFFCWRVEGGLWCGPVVWDLEELIERQIGKLACSIASLNVET